MYEEFANVYDSMIKDVDYKRLSTYINRLLEEFCDIRQNDLVLDLGCGTGSLIVELAKYGYDMIGVDISFDMLNIAREKLEENGVSALLLNQDMTEFELYGTVKAVVSTLDCMNYVTSAADLKKIFALVHNYLDDDGVFIFDINTEYKFENVFAKNTFHFVSDDVAYIWQCDYDKRRRACDFDLTFFVWNDDIKGYERFDEQQTEKMYKRSDLEKYLQGAGFKVLKVYDEYTCRNATNKSERAFYICKKAGRNDGELY